MVLRKRSDARFAVGDRSGLVLGFTAGPWRRGRMARDLLGSGAGRAGCARKGVAGAGDVEARSGTPRRRATTFRGKPGALSRYGRRMGNRTGYGHACLPGPERSRL